jgi:hypothetical protein
MRHRRPIDICLLEAKFRELMPCARFVRLGSGQWPISFTLFPKAATSSRWMISFFFSGRGGRFSRTFVLQDQCRKFRELLPLTGVCAGGRRPRVPLDRHDRRIPNSIRILGGRTRERIRVGSQSRLSCPQDRGGGTLRRRGQIFSEFRPPPLRDHRRVGRCLVALGGLFTTCHFIVVISAERGCAKDGKAEAAREGFARDREKHVRRPIHAPLQNCNVSGARMDDHVASVSAQTVLGGVLGGNLAFYTMITAITGL